MFIKSKDNPNAHLTVKERQHASFPTRHLHQNGYLHGRILDFGCGLGRDVTFLQQNGYEVEGYDPYYAKEFPKGKFDTIICNYVLNVLMPEEQAGVLMEVSELLKPSGTAYFTVRRDIAKNGFRYNPKKRCEVYQCNVKLNQKSILLAKHCEIYEYRHFNQPLIRTPKACPFCQPIAERRLITETATVYATSDRYSTIKGHSLIIPKRHTFDYFSLRFKEQQAIWLVVNRVKQILTKEHQPEGFNIRINNGKVAGQSVPHVHIHLIPRYEGDGVEDFVKT